MKRMAKATGVFALLAVGAVCAQSNGYRPLEAQYVIRGESLVDPSPDEKKDRVSLWFTGEGAKSIYDAMPGKARGPACGGGLVKQAGGLVCNKNGDDYTCSAAIILNSGKTDIGSVC